VERYDFVVVGGGIAGASAAYELAGHGSVVLLEKEAVCGHHSTGRSAAVFTECYGDELVRRLAIASRPFLDNPPPGFSAGPLLEGRPVLFVGRADQNERLNDAAADFGALVPSVDLVTAAEAVVLCPVLRSDHIGGGVLEPEAQDLDVHGLHGGFLSGARARGAVVRTSAGVDRISTRNESWELSITDGDEIQAAVVVNAAGAWCDDVAAMAGIEPVGLQPLRRTAFTFSPPEGVDHRRWPMIVAIDESYYFKPEGPGLLGSPGDEAPVPPGDARHDEIDVAVAISRIQEATTMTIRHVASAWAGLRSFVADRRPVIGADPGSPSFYWLAGQGGFGIKTSPAAGRAIASLVVDDVLPPDLIEIGITRNELAPGRLRRG